MAQTLTLPSPSILKLHRALGVAEFAMACGWEPWKDDFYLVPWEQFDSIGDLVKFCSGYEVETFLGGPTVTTSLREVDDMLGFCRVLLTGG